MDEIDAMLLSLSRNHSNEVSNDSEDFYISYNKKTDTGPETAIVTKEEITNTHFYILLGDYRKNYEGKSLSECLEFFKQNKDKMSKWSDDYL